MLKDWHFQLTNKDLIQGRAEDVFELNNINLTAEDTTEY